MVLDGRILSADGPSDRYWCTGVMWPAGMLVETDRGVAGALREVRGQLGEGVNRLRCAAACWVWVCGVLNLLVDTVCLRKDKKSHVTFFSTSYLHQMLVRDCHVTHTIFVGYEMSTYC